MRRVANKVENTLVAKYGSLEISQMVTQYDLEYDLNFHILKQVLQRVNDLLKKLSHTTHVICYIVIYE